MAELWNDVYDVCYPSPATLHHICSIAVAGELWRYSYSRRNIANRFQIVRLCKVVPQVPPSIGRLVDKYVDCIANSVEVWRRFHRKGVFLKCEYTGRVFDDNVIVRFDDFVYDVDGSIHYFRTAEKWILNGKKMHEIDKFSLACFYCMENNILKLWPTVSTLINSITISFSKYSMLYYWTHRLRNQPYTIPGLIVGQSNEPIDVGRLLVALRSPGHVVWSSLEYFWNLTTTSDTRIEIIQRYSSYAPKLIARYLLAKLTDDELSICVALAGVTLIHELFDIGAADCIIVAWTCVVRTMCEHDFIDLFEDLFYNSFVLENDADFESMCCELWRNTPKNFKQLAIRDFFTNQMWRDLYSDECGFFFIVTLLSDPDNVSVREKNTLWNKYWQDLFAWNELDSTSFNQLMSAFFDDSDQIAKFKDESMSKYEIIAPICFVMLRNANFVDIDSDLRKCCSTDRTIRNLKQQLLQSVFIGRGSIFSRAHVAECDQLYDFINEAYGEDLRLADQFKNQLLWQPVTIRCLLDFKYSSSVSNSIKFIEKFLTNEIDRVRFKKRLVNSIRGKLIDRQSFNRTRLNEFLLWCLENEDRIEIFKESLPKYAVLEYF